MGRSNIVFSRLSMKIADEVLKKSPTLEAITDEFTKLAKTFIQTRKLHHSVAWKVSRTPPML